MRRRQGLPKRPGLQQHNEVCFLWRWQRTWWVPVKVQWCNWTFDFINCQEFQFDNIYMLYYENEISSSWLLISIMISIKMCWFDIRSFYFILTLLKGSKDRHESWSTVYLIILYPFMIFLEIMVIIKIPWYPINFDKFD